MKFMRTLYYNRKGKTEKLVTGMFVTDVLNVLELEPRKW